MSLNIQIHIEGDDPNGVRVVSRPGDWTGVAINFRRNDFSKAAKLPELAAAGVYLLWSTNPEIKVYVGQSGNVGERLKSHLTNKDFWTHAVAFTAPYGTLNTGHIEWLENELYEHFRQTTSFQLENQQSTKKSIMSRADKGSAGEFLQRITQTMPFAGFHLLENDADTASDETLSSNFDDDTIIVPTGKAGHGFEDVFIAERCWYWLRLTDKRIKTLRYILAYRPAPVSAITMKARIRDIEPYGDEGKFRINFDGPAEEIEPIPFGDAKSGAMQGPRYTSSLKVQKAKKLTDLF